MAIRVNRLLSELNIGLNTLKDILYVLGYKEQDLTPNSKILDDIAILVRELYSDNGDFQNLIEIVAKRGVFGNQNDSTSTFNNLNEYKSKQGVKNNQNNSSSSSDFKFSEKQNFWISEIAILSPENKINSIKIGSFDEAESLPLYSVLIGTNGVGKSSLMKEIVDFFIDLHSYAGESEPKLSSVNKGRLKGIKYHIDGVECEVIRLKKTFFTRIDGRFCTLKDLRIPSIVACHFGAFDKFPTQKVNGSAQTKYDVPYYKYVGAHVNGSMISSAAIAFRMLFALNEQMDNRQRQNICSILDFIGYDHKISLSYSFVMKSRKDRTTRENIVQRVEKDREYKNLNIQEKNEKVSQLHKFYISKTLNGRSQYNYDIAFEGSSVSKGTLDELHYIYKLKQYDLVSSANVIFHKQGCDITSDDMSSGEFAMLSTVLSISAAASEPHTLVLLDEPEMSLHPNWQMTLIDNLDRALAKNVCHLLIATHSHMLVSDLPIKRSSVTQIEKDKEGNLNSSSIAENTYGWSPEEVLLKVFQMSTDRNRYLVEMVGDFIKKITDNDISIESAKKELDFLKKVAVGLSAVDPIKKIISTITEEFDKNG